MKKKIPWFIFIFLLILFPLVFRDNYVIHIFTMSCIYGVLVLSWDILGGYGGMFSFGHPIFFGLGAYASALMAIKLGISPWLGLLIGGLAGLIAGGMIAFPVLRLRGPYVAIVTVSFLIIVHQISTNWVSLTQGPTGLSGIPSFGNIRIFGFHLNFDGTDNLPHYYLAAFILVISTAIQNKFVNSSMGIHLLAIRDDESAAIAMGVNSTQCKIVAFLLTSFLAGLIGAYYAHYILLISPGVFGFDLMVTILTMSLLGGAATTFGPIIGAFLLTFVSEYLREFGDYRLFLYGIFIIVAITFMPEGILKQIWKKMLYRGVKTG